MLSEAGNAQTTGKHTGQARRQRQLLKRRLCGCISDLSVVADLPSEPG